MFVFVDITFYSSAPSAAKVTLDQCSRVSLIPLANHKLTFDERVGYITRHDDFVPRSHRAVSLQVAPFLKDCKGTCNKELTILRLRRVSRKYLVYVYYSGS